MKWVSFYDKDLVERPGKHKKPDSAEGFNSVSYDFGKNKLGKIWSGWKYYRVTGVLIVKTASVAAVFSSSGSLKEGGLRGEVRTVLAGVKKKSITHAPCLWWTAQAQASKHSKMGAWGLDEE